MYIYPGMCVVIIVLTYLGPSSGERSTQRRLRLFGEEFETLRASVVIVEDIEVIQFWMGPTPREIRLGFQDSVNQYFTMP